jgi:hypothetical protein
MREQKVPAMPDPATDAGNAADRPPAPKPQAAVLRRLPGKARPREDALREYRDLNAKRRSNIPAPLWPFWAPDPDEYYRWRVQLDCNCIIEVLTSGPDHPPDSAHWPDLVYGARLPMGQILCAHEDSPPAPYREIIEWGNRRELTLPADPTEPPDWASAETWAVMRHDEPRACAFWTVTLSCGHVTEVAVSNLGWKPDDGPDRVSSDRLREMTTEWEELWAEQPDAQDPREREHTQRMLANGWPIPASEDLCYTCPRARFIVAYQRIGWLVPRKPEPKPARPPSRASLQRQLRQAEAQANELRRQLAQLDTPAKQQRDG